MPTPLDKLQPCLLDRLTDEEPEQRAESRVQRLISLGRYRAGVVRDLEWLLSSIGHFPEEPAGKLTFGDFPEAYNSVVNFGVRQLYGRLAPDMEAVEREMYEALIRFEPRIRRETLRVAVQLDRNFLSIEISGELWANPLPEKLYLKTRLDLESSQCSMEASHG